MCCSTVCFPISVAYRATVSLRMVFPMMCWHSISRLQVKSSVTIQHLSAFVSRSRKTTERTTAFIYRATGTLLISLFPALPLSSHLRQLSSFYSLTFTELKSRTIKFSKFHSILSIMNCTFPCCLPPSLKSLRSPTSRVKRHVTLRTVRCRVVATGLWWERKMRL